MMIIEIIKNRAVCRLRGLAEDESGMGVVEVVLIILVLVGLAVLFKSNITGVVRTLLASIRSQTTNF